MAFRIPGIRKASLSASKGTNVPKGYLAVYVGDKMRRFVIPRSKAVHHKQEIHLPAVKHYLDAFMFTWMHSKVKFICKEIEYTSP
ncbi:hypothetical protein AHAS_Ahas13G0079600 [Arachis hypogaea]